MNELTKSDHSVFGFLTIWQITRIPDDCSKSQQDCLSLVGKSKLLLENPNEAKCSSTVKCIKRIR